MHSLESHLAAVQEWWDAFYNGWLSFLPEHHRPVALVLTAMLLILGITVLYYRHRLAKTFKGHQHLNRKLDELQRDVYRANDKALNKTDPHVAEMRQLFTTLLQSMEKSSATTANSIANQAKNSNDALSAACKEAINKIDSSLTKAMERIEKTQDAGNKVLTETIRQFVDLAKSQHTASMQAVREAVQLNDDDDDDADEDEE